MLQRCLSFLPHCEEERHVDRVSPGSVKDTWIERHSERVRLERCTCRAHSSAGRATKVQLFPGISRAPRKPWKFRRSLRHCQISGVVVGGCRHREDATFQKLECKFTKYDIQYMYAYNPYQSLAHFSSISLSVQNQGLSSSLFSFQNFIVHMQSREESKASQSSQHHPSTPPRWLSWHLKRLSM